MKAPIEKIQTIDIFSVSMKDTCEMPCMKHMWHDEIWDYFDYKSIFGIDNPQTGCGYALSKETIVSILEDGNKGLDAVSEREKNIHVRYALGRDCNGRGGNDEKSHRTFRIYECK